MVRVDCLLILVGFLLAGSHDLHVLEGAVRRVVMGVAAGDTGAVAHGDRGGGQLCQALVLTVHRQLVCKAKTHRKLY